MDKNEPLTIDEIHGVALEIMKDVDRFCRDNNIPYSLACGTLLGAVRHKGFIPWDDDVDLFMLREDYDRFISSYKSDKYNLIALGYAKVVDPTTSVKDDSTSFNYGVFVDIFPLDHVPEDMTAQKEHIHKLMSTHNRIYHRQKKDILSIIKSYRHSMQWWVNKLYKIANDPRYTSSPLVAHAVGARKCKVILNQDRFKSLVDIPFEGYKFLGFSDTHSYLVMDFGPDYMTPKRWSHSLEVYKTK